MAQLAFYKGKGNWVDKLIRFVTRSPYSHVELILEPKLKSPIGGSSGGTNAVRNGGSKAVTCYSSSARDGGVRIKAIILNPDHWDLVDIEWYVGDHIERLFADLAGSKYDYLGLAFSQFFNWRRHCQTRWFCSEIIAFALGIPNANSYSPGDLKALVAKLNTTHRQGICEGRRDV